jgi:hypothetical protein
MLSQWLVGEKEETQGSSSVLVSGAGSEEANGTYTERGEENGKPYYNLVGEADSLSEYSIFFGSGRWAISDFQGDLYYEASEDVEFPWLVEIWGASDVGTGPSPTVTEIPAANPIANYVTLPERYLWAKIAVAAGAPKDEAFYINAPKQYAWKDIYDTVSGSSLGTIDWGEKQALGHIAAAYRGDTGNPANLATYIDWPWRYQVASIITQLVSEEEPPPEEGPTYEAVIISGAGYSSVNGTYHARGENEGKPYYNLYGIDSNINLSCIIWNNGVWKILDSGGDLPYVSNEDVEFPWLVQTWSVYTAEEYEVGEEPAPTVTLQNVPLETVVVSGAGSAIFNGQYFQEDFQEGRFRYLLPTDESVYDIFWNGSNWVIGYDGEINYYSEENVDFPWLAETWLIDAASPPAPTVTTL